MTDDHSTSIKYKVSFIDRNIFPNWRRHEYMQIMDPFSGSDTRCASTPR